MQDALALNRYVNEGPQGEMGIITPSHQPSASAFTVSRAGNTASTFS
jgi:hypothetical protein